MSGFFKYFKENMDGLGLPAPEALFGNLQVALSSVTALQAHIDKFGKAVTVREAIGATTRFEKLLIIGSFSVSYYVGACIGSIAVATGRSLANGTSLGDVLYTASRYGINRSWLPCMLQRWPSIYKQAVGDKQRYRHVAAR
jgi:hypothetical protein